MTGLAADGFDVALSYALTVDHGIVQSYDMVRGGADLLAGPAGGQHRRATAAADAPLRGPWPFAWCGVRAADAGRVLIIASGGLSHWLPSNDPRDASVPAERRAAMIHGRLDVRAASYARESRVRALGGNPDAPVNAAWDAWFLKQLVTADLDPVTELGDELLEERAGSGGHEIRTWLSASPRSAGRWCGRATSRYRNGSPAWVSARRSRWPDDESAWVADQVAGWDIFDGPVAAEATASAASQVKEAAGPG